MLSHELCLISGNVCFCLPDHNRLVVKNLITFGQSANPKKKILTSYTASASYDQSPHTTHMHTHTHTQTHSLSHTHTHTHTHTYTNTLSLSPSHTHTHTHTQTHMFSLYVEDKLGSKYVEKTSIPFEVSFQETGPGTPVYFVLSPGVDPLKDVEALGKKMGISTDNGKFHNVSLGQVVFTTLIPYSAIFSRHKHFADWPCTNISQIGLAQTFRRLALHRHFADWPCTDISQIGLAQTFRRLALHRHFADWPCTDISQIGLAQTFRGLALHKHFADWPCTNISRIGLAQTLCGLALHKHLADWPCTNI